MSEQQEQRATFSSRKAFIFAAIGSAVGLGNIWRFPYVAYDNGGGAFVIPYLVALLTAASRFCFWNTPSATAIAARPRWPSAACANGSNLWAGGT